MLPTGKARVRVRNLSARNQNHGVKHLPGPHNHWRPLNRSQECRPRQ
jgi:hypothetical protein